MEVMGLGMSARQKRRGGSVLEAALIVPWYIFLFVGAFDWGCYSRALISLEGAARNAALNASIDSAHATDTVAACQLVRVGMKSTVNVAASGPCNSLPLIVTTTVVTGADGRNAASVSVSYRTQKLIPIPGLLAGQVTLSQTIEMPLRG